MRVRFACFPTASPSPLSNVTSANHHPTSSQQTEGALSTHRSRFDTSLTAARLLVTHALKYGLPLWYARTPLFWLPYGWLPYYAEWLIALPRAPLGSVSVATWQVACAAVIHMAWDTAVAVVGLVVAAEKGGGNRLRKRGPDEAEKVPAAAGGPKEEAAATPDRKTEL